MKFLMTWNRSRSKGFLYLFVWSYMSQSALTYELTSLNAL